MPTKTRVTVGILGMEAASSLKLVFLDLVWEGKFDRLNSKHQFLGILLGAFAAQLLLSDIKVILTGIKIRKQPKLDMSLS